MKWILRGLPLLPLLLASCAKKPATAVVVVVSSDLSFPADARTLEVEVTRDGSTKVFLQLDLPDGVTLPGTLTLDNDDSVDPSTPMRVELRAVTGSTPAVTRSAVLAMAEDKVKLLRMPLSAACKGKTCGAGQTCDAGVCVNEAVDVGNLPDFEGNDAALRSIDVGAGGGGGAGGAGGAGGGKAGSTTGTAGKAGGGGTATAGASGTAGGAGTSGSAGTSGAAGAGGSGTPGMKKVFVTSQLYTAALGGLSGADAKCQMLATAAGLSGTFMAWLSDTKDSPSTRFTKAGGWALVDGTVVANDWTELTSGKLLAAISKTEKGGAAPATAACSSQHPSAVFTATNANGTPDTTKTPNSCADWTSAASATAQIVWGNPASATSWTYSANCNGFGVVCGKKAALYCFEQ